MIELNKVYCGDVLEVLKQVDDESIDMIITSPPYYSVRDYKIKGQIGLEPTPEEYLDRLLKVTAELKRVLKPSGSLWWNMGDTYGSHTIGSSEKAGGNFQKELCQSGSYPRFVNKSKVLRDKCLGMLPERLAIRMIDEQGWILRNKIVWCKQLLLSKENRTVGSVMPTSTRDRFNESWEYLFFFVKNKKYYSNLDAVRIPHQVVGVTDLRPPGIIRQALYPESKYIKEPDYGGQQFKLYYRNSKYSGPEEEKQFRQGMHKLRGQGIVEKRYNLLPQKEFVDKLRANFTIEELVEKTGLPRTTVEHWFRYDESGFSYPSKEDWEKVGEKGKEIFPELLEVVYETDAIGKYQGKFCGMGKEAEKYGSPRARTERKRSKTLIDPNVRGLRQAPEPGEPNAFHPFGKNIPTVWQINPEPHNFRKELGIDVEHFACFPSELVLRPIKFSTKPGDVVLDPFCGSGTTLIVAKELGRQYIGIDLNPDYVKLAELRLSKVQVQKSLDEFTGGDGRCQ